MSTRQIRFLLCPACALLACLWILLERLILPNWSAQDGVFIFLGFGIIAWLTTHPVFFRKYVGEATPESLGAIRIIICSILLIMTLWMEDLPSSALLPAELRGSMGAMKWFYSLPGFESFVSSQTSLQLFEWLTALILILGIIGWQTRIALPLGAFCYLILGGILRQYTWFYHTGLIPDYILVVLSVTPCADGLSIDRLGKIKRGQTVPVADKPLPIYGWSRYACWVVIALSYVAAGLSKIYKSGFFWWNPDNMRAIILSSTLDPVQANWEVALKLVHAPDIVFAFLGIAGLYGELAFGLVLFSRIARLIVPIFTAMLHIGIWFLQDIVFLDLILIQLVFYDYTETRNLIQKWIQPKNQSIQVSFDAGADNDDSQNEVNLAPRETNFISQLIRNFRKDFYYPFLVSALAITMSFVWFKHIEFYPITSLQMFSGNNQSGKIGYSKLIAHYESGKTARIYPDTIIYPPMNTRYRLTLKGCLLNKPKGLFLCDKLLSSLASVHNRKASLGKKIKQFEVQQWSWNFRDNPSDPNYGKLVNRHIFNVEEQTGK